MPISWRAYVVIFELPSVRFNPIFQEARFASSVYFRAN
jgi:hypothetical protein